MSKNILVIVTGPRRGGNSETLADAFIKQQVEISWEISLRNLRS